jgi:hypothetical protein
MVMNLWVVQKTSNLLATFLEEEICFMDLVTYFHNRPKFLSMIHRKKFLRYLS